ncbi:MAG: glycosyltransferase family 4 protein [Actinobacteria bacterium]|nr:glycosyltransferase family 4 protein [Actinomycetota bacterium]
MRIGIVAPAWVRVPPTGYGGIEQVVSLLTEELVARGHDVTLFASGDSETKAALIPAFPEAPVDRLGDLGAEAVHVGQAYRRAESVYRAGDGFDLLHDHSRRLGVAFAATLDTPVVHTAHFAVRGEVAELYERFQGAVYLTAVSDHQAAEAPDLPWRAVVRHAVDVQTLPFRETKDDYLLCLGSIRESKGQDVAIEAARAAGAPIVIAGRVHPDGEAFFRERIVPEVDGERVRFLGEITAERKVELLAGARALLFPVRRPEPFGLVMLEAMACGTPVVAPATGAVPELVDDGRTGILAEGADDVAAAVKRIGRIRPDRCRRHVEERFHPRRMVDEYEAVYRGILAEL